MGTAQLIFAEVLWGATESHVTGSDMTGSDVSHMTGSCSISALEGPFGRRWRQSRDWKRPCPEVALTGSRFCACTAFSRAFFLVVVTWLPDVTKGHLSPFGVPLGVRMRNRKLHNTRSSSKQCWLGVFSTTSVSYNHRKPCVLYLAWWLELALVICPFYFHIVSRLCSTLLKYIWKFPPTKMLFFYIFLHF